MNYYFLQVSLKRIHRTLQNVYIKPTTEVPESSYIIRLDVKSLYTSIPNSEGVKAVKISHENFTKKTITTKVITTFLALNLNLNNFILNSKQFLQTNMETVFALIKGCAMETICASIQGKSLPYFRYMIYSSFGQEQRMNLSILQRFK